MKTLATDLADLPPVADKNLRGHEPWHAHLALGFANDGGTTRLVERSHHGPLRVQKSLHPEGPGICHAIVVHPPGGVVGGDQLGIDVTVQPHAHAFLTSPGAAKWYKANQQQSQQQVKLLVQAGASLEWLPQETIFFKDAQVRLVQDIQLAADASFVGWEILCFGRTASGESFDQGRVTQASTIRRDGKLIWYEQGSIDGAGEAMQSPLALGGFTVCATMLVAGKTVPASLLQEIRDMAATTSTGRGAFGITQLKQMLVVRYLGQSSETARRVLIGAWTKLRPAVLGIDAAVPRIWNT